ncbi:MAG: hypothetical protein HC800_24820 [Phormidesmis sp. RL_2_1]|nr:hypothetical protein [Phormidesmis sp. RL_2_1]
MGVMVRGSLTTTLAAAAGNATGADDKWQLERFTRALRWNVQRCLEQTFTRLRQDARYACILLCETAVYAGCQKLGGSAT